MLDPDRHVAERILEKLRHAKLLNVASLAKLESRLAERSLSAEDWREICVDLSDGGNAGGRP